MLKWINGLITGALVAYAIWATTAIDAVLHTNRKLKEQNNTSEEAE